MQALHETCRTVQEVASEERFFPTAVYDLGDLPPYAGARKRQELTQKE